MLTAAKITGGGGSNELELTESISACGSNVRNKSLTGIGIVDADKSLLKAHLRTLVTEE